MAQVSINQLSELTGKDRRTVKSRLSTLNYSDGAKGAQLYESVAALEAIYFGQPGSDEEFVSTPEALRRKTIAQEEEIKLDMEIKRKERIPLVVCAQVDDEVQQSIAGILKSHKGKELDTATINDIFAQLRDIPGKRKW